MKSKKIFPSTIFSAVILIVCTIVIVAPSLFFTDYLSLYLNKEYIDRIPVFIFFLLILLFSFFINQKRGIAVSFSFKLPINLSLIGFSILLVIALQVGINSILCAGINNLLDNHYPIKNSFEVINFSLFSTVLLSPFLEELLFRGTILKGFLSNYSVVKSIVYSSVIFGLIHFAPATIICAIILGLFFGWLYYKTDSITLTFILHAVANFTILVTEYFRYHISDNLSWYNIYGKYSFLIIFLSVLVVIVCFVQLIKQFRKL
ncbi:MAG: CPBP family intramembrane metalloprotease [Prevotellaceae bacterium]|jgi:membrane protease YdiL (CAAX protease family)|nr:CPBP family intramembrane metalloprotease [Prevotellaceae bacterium]